MREKRRRTFGWRVLILEEIHEQWHIPKSNRMCSLISLQRYFKLLIVACLSLAPCQRNSTTNTVSTLMNTEKFIFIYKSWEIDWKVWNAAASNVTTQNGHIPKTPRCLDAISCWLKDNLLYLIGNYYCLIAVKCNEAAVHKVITL